MNAPPLLVRADARALPLPDASVDLVVTSPPYYGLRDYGTPDQIGAEQTPADYLDQLLAATAEAARVLRPSGSLFVNLGDKYSGAQGQTQTGLNGRATMPNPTASATWQRTNPTRTGTPAKSLLMLPERYRIRCVDELGLIARAVVVWAKPNGLPESVTDRVRRSHEDWVHLTKAPRYYAAVDDIRESPTSRLQRRFTARSNDATPRLGQPHRAHQAPLRDAPGVEVHPLGRLPGSVWTVPTQPLHVPEHVGADHYAAFPMEWPRRLITGWCPPEGVVLDPFGGTGTTALVAAMLGRTGISVDSSADYQRVAAWRCSDPRERARAAGLDASRVPAVRPDQTGLFEVPGGVA